MKAVNLLKNKTVNEIMIDCSLCYNNNNNAAADARAEMQQFSSLFPQLAKTVAASSTPVGSASALPGLPISSRVSNFAMNPPERGIDGAAGLPQSIFSNLSHGQYHPPQPPSYLSAPNRSSISYSAPNNMSNTPTSNMNIPAPINTNISPYFHQASHISNTNKAISPYTPAHTPSNHRGPMGSDANLAMNSQSVLSSLSSSNTTTTPTSAHLNPSTVATPIGATAGSGHASADAKMVDEETLRQYFYSASNNNIQHRDV
jgi:hypothetical protein